MQIEHNLLLLSTGHLGGSIGVVSRLGFFCLVGFLNSAGRILGAVFWCTYRAVLLGIFLRVEMLGVFTISFSIFQCH